MTTASVAVIGGGVIGASVAYHLAARGWRDVLILDRSAGPGREAPARHRRVPRAVRHGDQRAALAPRAGEALSLRGGDRCGPGYAPARLLWLGADEAELAALRAGSGFSAPRGCARRWRWAPRSRPDQSGVAA